MDNIIWQKPDMSLASTTLLEDTDPYEHAVVLQRQGDVPANWVVVGVNLPWADSGLPQECYRFVNGEIVADPNLVAKHSTQDQIIQAKAKFTDTIQLGCIAQDPDSLATAQSLYAQLKALKAQL